MTDIRVSLLAYGGTGLPIGYILCFKTRFSIDALWTGLTLALIFAAGLVLRTLAVWAGSAGTGARTKGTGSAVP